MRLSTFRLALGLGRRRGSDYSLVGYFTHRLCQRQRAPRRNRGESVHFFSDVVNEPSDQVTTRVPAGSLPRRCGRTTISTSWPSAFRKRNSRSAEKPASLPRIRADTFGWSTPKSDAAFAWVSRR